MLKALKQFNCFRIISIFLIVLSSCKKNFLDVEDTSQLYRQTYVKDLATMSQFMNGIYVMLNDDYEDGIGAAYPDLVADNLKTLAAPSTQALFQHYTWSQQATEKQESTVSEQSSSMNGSWTNGYLIIRACNFVLEDIGKYRSEDIEKADDIKGQALAVRAMVHFKLANIFSQSYNFTSDASHPGIPYIKTSDISAAYNRQTVAVVYDNLVEDLNNAIQALQPNITDTRYMNLAAAKALLARIYLFKEDYSNSLNLAREISSQFPLLTIGNGYPNDLFKDKKPSQSEILYRLTPVNQSGIASYFLGARFNSSFLLYIATNDIANVLNENANDIRNSWVSSSGGEWEIKKFPIGVAGGLGFNTATDYYPPIIRSSEMFLTVAEASAKLGDENTARTYLDAIRKRADPTKISSTATGMALIDSIYKERRRELCFEGLRMYDLQRWKLGVHRVDALSGAPKDLPFPSDRAISPIPILDLNLAGLEQNSNY